MDQTTIYNLALSAIGTRSTVASPTENSAESNALNLHYAPAIESILQAARWNFARRQALLTVLNDATQSQPVPTPWLYEYALPSDCVQARYVMPTIMLNSASSTVGTPSAPTALGPPVKFLMSTDLDTNGNQIMVLLTNQIQATLVYTSRITNPNLFDGSFIEALSVYLGARVCMALTGDKALTKGTYEHAASLCKTAQASNGNEGLTVIDNVPDWMKVRGYASDWGQTDGSFSYGPSALQQVS